MNPNRDYSLMDKVCLTVDETIRALFGQVKTTGQTYPAAGIPASVLQETERKHAAGLMRVNHTGEICAQALYHGQALVSRTPYLRVQLKQAAIEEGDHLSWCQERLQELGSHRSYLNPVWYAGSFCIGMAAGMVGDAWSLGFVAETEKQVIKHLAGHLSSLPQQDLRSAAILKKMEADEAKHRHEALTLGAKELPSTVQTIMSWMAKLMVKTAYWI